MRDIDTFNILVRADIPNCPDFVIERHALRVIRDFCAKTSVWTETIEDTISSGENELILTLSAGEGHEILDLDGYSLSWSFSPPDRIDLDDAVTADTDVEVVVALKPRLDDTDAPEWLLDKYEDGIVAGIYARLMMQDNQAWTNPALGAKYEREYNAHIGQARTDKLKKHKTTPLRVIPGRFI
jgi:hypothetical protein